LPLPSATTDGDNFVSVIEIDTVDANGDAEDLGVERDPEVLLEHGQEADTLFRVAVSIDDRFFNQRLKLTPGQARTRALPTALIRLLRAGHER
jgi:hypothetical protein